MSETTVGDVNIGSSLGRLVIATTVLGSSVAMLTATVVNVALPTIAAELGATSSAQQWIVNAYLLAMAALILIGGSLGDRFGRLRVYRIGVVWFGVASLLCAAAPNVEVLIAARLLQGVGGALLTPGSLAIIEATLRHNDRGRGVGLWSGLVGLAGAVGPVVGGIVVEFSWRWIFLLNLPIVVATFLLSLRLPESSTPGARRNPLDLIGATLTVLTLGGTSYALIEGPNNGFSDIEVGVAGVAMASLAGLLIYEPNRDNAMVPTDLFAVRTFAVANAITFLVYGGMGLVFFLMSIQLQVTVGLSPLKAGASFLPITVLMLAFSARAGDVARRVGPRAPLTAGPLLIAAGMLCFTRIGPDATYAATVLPGVVLFGFGLTFSVAPVTATALGSVDSSRSGAASGTNNAISRTGQLLSIAAIPPLVGLTGDSLSNPDKLDGGFQQAMFVGAGFAAAGAALAATLLPTSRSLRPPQF